jgi:hypothetical protein
MIGTSGKSRTNLGKIPDQAVDHGPRSGMMTLAAGDDDAASDDNTGGHGRRDGDGRRDSSESWRTFTQPATYLERRPGRLTPAGEGWPGR